jgi:energy-coupling factor transport system permease protein
MVSASLQMVPIVQREFQIVLSAQRSRGMRARGFSSVLPSMVPVFAGTIERVQQLAMSLESRAFGSKGVKTSLRESKATIMDYVLSVAAVVLAAVGTSLVVYYRDPLDWSKIEFLPPWLSVTIVLAAALTFIVFTVALWRQAQRE